MARPTCWILIVLAFVAYDQSFVEAACPFGKGDAEKEMKRCLGSVGLGAMESGGGGMHNWVQFKKHCSDGSLDQAVTCVQNIIDDCKANEQIADALNKVVSVKQLRQGFHYICENVDVLAENKECMYRAAQPMGVCAQAETTKFQSEVRTRSQSGQLNEDDIWELTCGFMDKVFACQHTAFLEACNDKVAEVLTTFMQSVRPPMCETDAYSSTTSINSSPTSIDSSTTSIKNSTSNRLIFSGLFLLIVLHLSFQPWRISV